MNTDNFAMIVQLFDLLAQLYIFGSIALVFILFFDHLFSSLSILLDKRHTHSLSPEIDLVDQIKELFRYDSQPEQLTST